MFTYSWSWQRHVNLLLRPVLTEFQNILRYGCHIGHEPLPHIGKHCKTYENAEQISEIDRRI